MIDYSFAETKKFPKIFCFFVAFVFVLPTFFIGQPTGDAIFHVSWSNAYADEFWKGNFFPGWINAMNAGCGSPDLFFYTTFPYFINSLFEPLDFDGKGWIPLIITTLVFSSVGAYGSFKLFRMFSKSNVPALLAMSLYVFSPLFMMIYYWNFMFSFFVSAAIGPYLLVSAVAIGRGRKDHIFVFSLVLGLLIYTNISGMMLFGALSFGLALVVAFFEKQGVLSTLFCFICATLLGVVFSAFYTLPMMTMLENTAYLQQVYGEKNNFKVNFLGFFTSKEYEQGRMPLTREVLNIVIYIYMGLSLLFAWKLRKSEKKIWIFWLLAVFLGIFLTQSSSEIVWEYLPLLQKVQFPIRVLLVVSVAFAALVGVLIVEALKKKPLNDIVPLFGILFFVFILGPFGFLAELAIDIKPVDQELFDKIYSNRIVKNNFFMDKSATGIDGMIKDGKIDELIEQCDIGAEFSDAKGTMAEIVYENNRIIVAKVDTPKQQTLKFDQIYFKNWRARIDGAEVDISALPPLGQMVIDVPEGKHHIVLEMPRSAAENFGQIFTLISFFIILFGMERYKTQSKTSPKKRKQA